MKPMFGLLILTQARARPKRRTGFGFPSSTRKTKKVGRKLAGRISVPKRQLYVNKAASDSLPKRHVYVNPSGAVH